MYTINKIVSNPTIDFAAEELKKYLRMMMPENGDVDIIYNPDAKGGFRLGLMQDFNLDISDAEDSELDDIIYIDCSESEGIIAGDNYRSVLLAVYEYLKKNDCRWLLPGVDGECIPVKNIKPVQYRHKASCRYRGWCSEGAQFQQSVLDAIDFAPKLGLNGYFIQHINPHMFYTRYYKHVANEENRLEEPVSEVQVLQWKRQCEVEIAKRGMRFNDMGHGFNFLSFGVDAGTNKDKKNELTPEQEKYFAKINGTRKINGTLNNTQFCMSNPETRKKVCEYVLEYLKKHSNVDVLDVFLADGANNHCECDECKKKTPSDWYIILLNEIDEMLTEKNINTKIEFAAYTDTTWAPLEEKINNTDRFVLVFAPIFRSYANPISEKKEKSELIPYNRNNNEYPNTIEKSLDYLDEWKKTWKGQNVSFEYYFWRHQCYDLTGRMQAQLINTDIKQYKRNGFDGLWACGTQRSFFPNGLSFYTFARTLFDTSLSYEEIEQDYYLYLYGENWREFCDYFEKISDALPFKFFSRDEAWFRKNVHYDIERSEKISQIRKITKEGRKIIDSHVKSDMRVRMLGLKLLKYHADFCDLISDWIGRKAKGEIELAEELLQKARVETGKFESEIEKYFDHHLYFCEYTHAQNLIKSGHENVVDIE